MTTRRVIVGAITALLACALMAPGLASASVSHYITVSGPDGLESWPVTYVVGGANDGASVVTDPKCGTDAQDFRAVFYDHGDYNGDRVILCRSQPDFCWVPGHGYPLSVSCGWWSNNLNDEALSIIVGSIKTDGGCLRYFEHAGYDTGARTVRLRENTWYPSIPQVAGRGSSVKRLFAGQC